MKSNILIVAIISITFFSVENIQAQTKKEIVNKAFDAWESKGTSDVFDLLDDNVQWEIKGSTPWSKVYKSKQQFMDEVIIPLNKKLSVKIKPAVRHIYQDDKTVIVLWDGEATALDGKPYRASYSWNMTFDGDRIVSVIAFLDGMEFTDVMQRIKVD